jgi:Arc/MetJ family transcription regulator
MSTNIDLDRDLLDRARTALSGAGIKETVEEGLRRIVAERSLHDLAALVGEMAEDPQQQDLMHHVRDRAW